MSVGYVFKAWLRYTPENGSPVTVELKPSAPLVAGVYTVLVGTGLQYEPVIEDRDTVNFDKRILKRGYRVTVNLQWDVLFMVQQWPVVSDLLAALMQPGTIVELSMDNAATYREMVIKSGANLRPFRDKTFSGVHVDGPVLESKELIAEIPRIGTGTTW